MTTFDAANLRVFLEKIQVDEGSGRFFVMRGTIRNSRILGFKEIQAQSEHRRQIELLLYSTAATTFRAWQVLQLG